MLKKTITYTDYNGKQRTEDFYFHLSKAELTEMQMSSEGGLDEKLQAIINSNTNAEIMKLFKEIIMKAYGEKSDDGRHFIKVRNGVHLSEEFEQSEAYVQMYMEFAQNDKAAAAFINGVLPEDLVQKETPATIAANS